jgi:uncharacterized membrane protein required for colicin V production
LDSLLNELQIMGAQRWLDVLVIAFLVWRGYSGFRNGLITELSRLVGIVAGFTIGAQLSGRLAATFAEYMLITPNIATILAYLMIIVAILGITTTVGHAVTKFANILLLGWLNHLLGILIGLATAAFAVQTLLLLLISMKLKELIAGPGAVKFFLSFPVITSLLPPELAQPMEPLLDLLRTLY